MSHIDTKHITRGLEGGLIAGLSFGAMLGMTGMLDLLSALTHSPVIFLFFAHIIFSVIAGTIFSIVFGDYVKTDTRGLVLGLMYGFILWTLSVLCIWTLFKPFVETVGAYIFLPSLWAHLIYGFILGLVYDFVVPDSEQTDK